MASVASAVAGAVKVSTSPGANAVAVAIAKVAVVMPAANAIVPTAVPFWAIVKVADAVAAVPAFARLPVRPAGNVTAAAKT